MLGLRDALEQSQKDGVAIGHFNVADWVLLKAVLASGQELNVPVVVGASEGEREFVGVRQIAAVVRSLREECNCPIFLNADHTHSLAKAVEAARAGFDSIVFDLSALPFEQNVRQTKEAVEALKTINSAILVEGEIGDIGTGSEIHEKAPDLSGSLTSPAEARQFVESTAVDILAPAVGNMHGMLKSMVQGQTRKRLDIQRIAQIKNAAQVPLTLMADRVPTTKICGRQSSLGSISYTSTLNCGLHGGMAWRRAWLNSQTKSPHIRSCPSQWNR